MYNTPESVSHFLQDPVKKGSVLKASDPPEGQVGPKRLITGMNATLIERPVNLYL
jgi:hypothetical protein